jgi:hypothetical protein
MPETAGFILSIPRFSLTCLAEADDFPKRCVYRILGSVSVECSRRVRFDELVPLSPDGDDVARVLRSLDQVVDKGVVGLRSSMDWERAVTVGSAIVFLLGQSIAE